MHYKGHTHSQSLRKFSVGSSQSGGLGQPERILNEEVRVLRRSLWKLTFNEVEGWGRGKGDCEGDWVEEQKGESDLLPRLRNARSAFSYAVKESKDLLDLVRQS